MLGVINLNLKQGQLKITYRQTQKFKTTALIYDRTTTKFAFKRSFLVRIKQQSLKMLALSWAQFFCHFYFSLFLFKQIKIKLNSFLFRCCCFFFLLFFSSFSSFFFPLIPATPYWKIHFTVITPQTTGHLQY